MNIGMGMPVVLVSHYADILLDGCTIWLISSSFSVLVGSAGSYRFSRGCSCGCLDNGFTCLHKHLHNILQTIHLTVCGEIGAQTELYGTNYLIDHGK